jgi:hypothetical protein
MKDTCSDTTLLGSFLENHDQPRFASYTSDYSLAKNAIAFSILQDGIPIGKPTPGMANPFLTRNTSLRRPRAALRRRRRPQRPRSHLALRLPHQLRAVHLDRGDQPDPQPSHLQGQRVPPIQSVADLLRRQHHRAPQGLRQRADHQRLHEPGLRSEQLHPDSAVQQYGLLGEPGAGGDRGVHEREHGWERESCGRDGGGFAEGLLSGCAVVWKWNLWTLM